MYYRINVSLNGRHFFATAEQSITCRDKADYMYHDFKQRFPLADGFTITVTAWVTTGETINYADSSEEV